MSGDKVRNIAHDLDIERTQDVKTEEDITFEGLLLSKQTLEGLTKCGFSKPSPIQLKAIPLGKCGFDLIVEAKSGTGKTAVFSVVALESIQLDGGCQCVIVAPTREIAVQIGQVITCIGVAYEGLRVEIVMGGTNCVEDMARLTDAKYQILVGTPGRLKHFIKQKVISMDTVRLFVLDEADRLMEDSFQKDINFIYSFLPERKQVIVASATYTPELQIFLSNYMRSASHVNPYNSRILLGVDQYISSVKTHFNKVRQSQIVLEEVKRILCNVQFKQCLIFCNYQVTTRNIWKNLVENGWPAEYLSSSQTQENRLKSLSKLQSFECRILVATDLASRGLDAANVDLVINLETPHNLATYLHRIGRCGRYGAKGSAVTILSEREEKKFRELLENYGDSFDIKPITCLLESKSEIKTNGDCVTNEIKPKKIVCDIVDITPLFIDNKEAINNVLNSFKQENVDMLLDPENDYSVDDYFSSFINEGTDIDEMPEFDYINHLRKTVPDFDKMTEYIESMYVSDDEYDSKDDIKNIEPVINVEQAKSVTHTSQNSSQKTSDKTKKKARTSHFNPPVQSATQSYTSRINVGNTESLQQQYTYVDSSDDSSTSHDAEDVDKSDDDEERIDGREEYWRWRDNLSMMSSFVQQSAYLQAIAKLHDMDMNEP